MARRGRVTPIAEALPFSGAWVIGGATRQEWHVPINHNTKPPLPRHGSALAGVLTTDSQRFRYSNGSEENSKKLHSPSPGADPVCSSVGVKTIAIAEFAMSGVVWHCASI